MEIVVSKQLTSPGSFYFGYVGQKVSICLILILIDILFHSYILFTKK